LEIEVVGCVTTAPTAVDVCSAYLVREGSATLLLDCGPGALHRLLNRHSLLDITAVIITHMHQDHCLDLLPAAGALLIQRRTRNMPGQTRLLVPPGATRVLDTLAGLFGAPGQGEFRNSLHHAFAVEEYAQPSSLAFGPVSVSFSAPLAHEVPCSAVRVESSGRSLCYSGDTAPCGAIVHHADGADLLLCEATFPHKPSLRQYLHLAPEEAGEIARASGARSLMLTHFARSDLAWRHDLTLKAQRHFAGPVSAAARDALVTV
jgi:ribonuclease BN (tRNA processing enzyme)